MSRFYVENNYYSVRLRSGESIPFHAKEAYEWCWLGVTCGKKRLVPISAIEWADVITQAEFQALEEAHKSEAEARTQTESDEASGVVPNPTSPIQKRGRGRPPKDAEPQAW